MSSSDKKRKRQAYSSNPACFIPEILQNLKSSFGDGFNFNIVKLQEDCIEVQIVGYHPSGIIQRYLQTKNKKIPNDIVCMRMSIKPVLSSDAREMLTTSFFITVHQFQTCTPRWIKDGQIQSLMERCIEFMQLLETTSPGEFRLKFDGDFTSDLDDNQIDGLNMRTLFTLAHGQPRLATLGIRDHLFNSKFIEFKRMLSLQFRLPPTVNKALLEKHWRLIGIATPMKRIPLIGEVFKGIFKRISELNDKLDDDDDDDTVLDEDEIKLWKEIITSYTKDVEKHFSSKMCHLFKVEDRQLPERDDDDVDVVQAVAIVRKHSTDAERLSRRYYESMFHQGKA